MERLHPSLVVVPCRFAAGLPALIVLGALDGRTRFIEQQPGTGEVAAVERVSGMLAGFDRLLVVLRVGEW